MRTQLTEYVCNQVDEHGDIVDQEIWSTKAKAMKQFEAEPQWTEIEKWVTHRIDNEDFVDRTYETIVTR